MNAADRRSLVAVPFLVGWAAAGCGPAPDDTPIDDTASHASALAAAPRYAIVDLGTLGGPQASASAINGSGQIAGGANTTAGGVHAFLSANGVSKDLGALGTDSNAAAINSAGAAAGWAVSPTDGRLHAALFRNGQVTDLGIPAGFRSSSAAGINLNPDGTVNVVGSSSGKGPGAYGSFTHAFLWAADGTPTDLHKAFFPDPLLRFSNANGINNAGQIVGTGTIDGATRGFVIAGGRMTSLGTLPGGTLSWAFAINEPLTDGAVGHITGASTTAAGTSEHAFLYVAGQMTDLGTVPGFRASTGRALNASDTVVGFAREPISKVTAALFQNGTAYDLNTLIPPSTGWVLQYATGISDAGVITGYGTKGGLQRAFALVPQ